MSSLVNEQSTGLSLVVDASHSPVHLGIPSADGWIDLQSYDGQAMEGIFSIVHQLFDGTNRKLNQVRTIYFCEGPGSTLGLRLAAAFVKTLLWESDGKTRLFQYNALDLAVRMADRAPASLQAPFRVGRRFVRLPGTDNGNVGEKIILDEEDALQRFPDSLHIPNPRRAKFTPPGKSLLPYDLTRICGLSDIEPISASKEQPVPYSPEPAVFKKWEPTIRPQ